MAIPPTIPTSFVPKQPVEMHPRHTESAGNMFMVTASALLGIAIVLAIAIFAYAHFLKNESESKSLELQTAQAGVSEETVDGFLRLRNRLTSSQTILGQHVMMSQFFDVLESLTLQGVRFTSLETTLNSDHSAELTLTGVAKNFNALAAQSAAFAQEKRIKQAIFSDITADKNGIVTFGVTAKLDPDFVNIPATVPAQWSGTQAPVEVATTTPVEPQTTNTTAPAATPGAATKAVTPAAPL